MFANVVSTHRLRKADLSKLKRVEYFYDSQRCMPAVHRTSKMRSAAGSFRLGLGVEQLVIAGKQSAQLDDISSVFLAAGRFLILQ